MTKEAILQRVLMLIPLVLSLSFHEWAHAASARRLGDTTAQDQGRLTLNPLAHIDFIGTLLLPMLGVPFGWAKPVPVDPTKFRKGVSMGLGMALTAVSGPLSNFLLAILCAVGLGALARIDTFDPSVGLESLLVLALRINVTLGVFNLLPLPPLDGSRIVAWLLPDRLRVGWERFGRYGPIVVLLIFASGTYFWGTPVRALTDVLSDVARAVEQF